MNWIRHAIQKPEVGQKVFYYFRYVGVHRGAYHGEHREYGSMYGGEGGFLTNDVTHWMPDDNDAELPSPPSNPAYLTKQKVTYYRAKNPAVPDDAECKACGHPYERHFDWMEDEDHQDVGCKYCDCYDFAWDENDAT